MKKARFFLTAFVAAFVAASVASIITLSVGCHQAVKTPEKMTAKERGVLATALYNNAFTNYQMQFDATPKPMDTPMREYFQAYKKAMEGVYPVIAAYNSVAQIGAVPTPEQEAAIIRAIYQLQAMLLSGGKG